MYATTFVLMNAELGSEDSIVTEPNKLEGVREVYQVYGVYDIVAQVEFRHNGEGKRNYHVETKKTSESNPH